MKTVHAARQNHTPAQARAARIQPVIGDEPGDASLKNGRCGIDAKGDGGKRRLHGERVYGAERGF
jgi:hypothetical protein